MASTSRSANGRATQSSRSSGSGSQPRTAANARSRTTAKRRSANAGPGKAAKREVANATSTAGSAAKKAKTPLVAGGAAAAGLATGTAIGALLRSSRRPRALGMPLPRGKDMKAGAQKAVSVGRWLYDMESDLRVLREHAERSRRQSPIEVLLSALTSRTLPRKT